jgi:hypothetical protein
MTDDDNDKKIKRLKDDREALLEYYFEKKGKRAYRVRVKDFVLTDGGNLSALVLPYEQRALHLEFDGNSSLVRDLGSRLLKQADEFERWSREMEEDLEDEDE